MAKGKTTKKIQSKPKAENSINVEAEKKEVPKETSCENKIATKYVKIKVLKMIRSSFGAFDKGNVYEVTSDVASILCKNGRCELCS